MDRKAGRLTLIELMPGGNLEEVREKTGADFDVAEGWGGGGGGGERPYHGSLLSKRCRRPP